MVTFLTWLRRALAVLIFTTAAAAGLRAGELQASLSGTTVPAGEDLQLTLKVIGGLEDLQVPDVPGVEFRKGGGGTEMSFSLGGGRPAYQSRTIIVLISSNKPGEYTIPPLTVKVDGVNHKTQEFKLTVTPSANQVPEGMDENGAVPPGVQAGVSTGLVTVNFSLKDGRKHIWVGEIAPVRIEAWLPNDGLADLSGKPAPEAPEFTLQSISDPVTSRRAVNNRLWIVRKWFAGFSATKPGTWQPDLSVEAVQRTRDPNTRRVLDQKTKLRSKDVGSPIEVRALPREGRPKDFGGAVGTFALESANFPAEWKTGEPEPLTAVVSGKGNFALLTQPVLRPEDRWKCYEGKSTLQSGDLAAFSGTQKWEFSAAAQKAGAQPLSLAFSYFNPDTGRYAVAESAVQNVTVTGADVPAESAAPAAAVVKAEGPDKLAPVRSRDSSAGLLTPLGLRPAFRTVLLSCGGLAAAGVLAALLRARRRDASRARTEAVERASRAALSEADAFAARNDAPAFFAAARRALQTRLAARWSRPAQAITLADVTARVPGDSPVTEIFREADRVEFGRADDVDLHPWRSRLHSAMNSLTA